MNAVDSVAFDHSSIKATTKTARNGEFSVENQSFKRKYEDDREYPLMLTYKRLKNVKDFW